MFFVLFALWIVFNGRITFEIIWIGLLLCAGIYFICWKFFGYHPKQELRYAKKTIHMMYYIWVLIKEIFKSNILVVKLILSRKSVTPVLVEFTTDLRTDLAKVILSHSITLTPGTITVELKGDTFLVNCLDESMATGLDDSEFIRLLKRMEAQSE
jgi:multicomponent Na+:H+ antiporter subunit E